jgi:hypothetical protein
VDEGEKLWWSFGGLDHHFTVAAPSSLLEMFSVDNKEVFAFDFFTFFLLQLSFCSLSIQTFLLRVASTVCLVLLLCLCVAWFSFRSTLRKGRPQTPSGILFLLLPKACSRFSITLSSLPYLYPSLE